MKRHILGKLLKLRNYGLNKKTTSGDELGEEVPDNADAIRIFINAINKEVVEGRNCLALTSYIPQQGKTQIMQLVTRALSDVGYKTLLIDLNIPSPYLSQVESVEGAKGILDFIEILQVEKSDVTYSDIMPYIRRLEEENLYFLPCFEQINSHYKKYIKKENLQYIFHILKNKFDIILIEAPTFNELSYTQSILEASDGYFMIIKKGKLLKREVFMINEKIEQIQGNLIGAILNKSHHL